MTMTWKNGRQLATLQDDENDITYNYDSNSVRISKNVNGVEYTYTYLNGMLVYETRGEAKFYYSYDSNGILYSIKYTLTDTSDTLTYYCTHNSRGDIIGIYNYQGTLRAKYEYDAWGNVLSVKDENGNEITSSTHVGNLNPFRYRGYYYDSETGLYYLMSRYYDPVTHRFLNADGYFQSGGDVLDANMSVYCRNNPIMFVDPTGCSPKTLRELQEGIVSSTKKLNYGMKDITKALKDGYSYDDKFTVSSSGGLEHYTVVNQVVDSAAAFFSSVELTAGAGYGIGASAEVYDVEISALLKCDLVSLSLSPTEGVDLGAYLYAGFTVFIDEIGWDDTQYISYLDQSKNYSSGCNNVPNKTELFSINGYFIIGGNITFLFNNDYYDQRWNEIWG